MAPGFRNFGGIDLEASESSPLGWHPFKPIDDKPLEMNDETEYVDVLGRSTGLERPVMAAEEYVRRACRIERSDYEHLVSRARDRDTATNRRLIVTLGADSWHQNRTELARVFQKNPDVVSWWVGEGNRRRMEDEAFASQLDELDRELSLLATTPPERRGQRTF